jgi:hypothetical protein
VKYLRHPATVVAAVVLFVALGGCAAAYASGLISGSQIKNHSIPAKKLTASAIKSLRGKLGPTGPKGATGPPGPKGSTGAPGPIGPSHGYSTGFTDSNPVTLTSAGENHTLMTLSVPSGHYIVIARLQGITGNDGGGNDFRYDCVLGGPAGAIDDPIYRVGETNAVENYLTYEGGYSGAGPITLVCRSANVHTLTALSGSMVAIAVGGLN